jgi:hypothetical protein
MWALGYGVEVWNGAGASVRVLPAPKESAQYNFPHPAQVTLLNASKLFLIGSVVVESLFLDEGEDLTIEAAPGTSIIVRALSRSRVHDGGRGGINCPLVMKEGAPCLSGKELSYLRRVSSFPADGTAARAGTYIYTGHTLLPASACSEYDLHTHPLMGGTEEGLAEATMRDSGVHTPFQHCCCVHMALCVCDWECRTCADSYVD